MLFQGLQFKPQRSHHVGVLQEPARQGIQQMPSSTCMVCLQVQLTNPFAVAHTLTALL